MECRLSKIAFRTYLSVLRKSNHYIYPKKKNFLSNINMGKLIAQMLGKTELPLADDGRVTLTAEERASVVNTYGEEFTRMLEETDFSTDDTEANSQELFDAAVNHVAEARIKP